MSLLPLTSSVFKIPRKSPHILMAPHLLEAPAQISILTIVGYGGIFVIGGLTLVATMTGGVGSGGAEGVVSAVGGAGWCATHC